MRLPHFRFFSKCCRMASDFQLGVADSYFDPVRLKPSHSVSGDQLGHHSWIKFPYISSEVFQKHQKTAKCIKMSYHWNSYVGLLSAPICSNGFLTTPSCQLRSLPFSTSPAAYPPPTVSMPKVKGVTSNRSKSCPPSPLKIPACTAAP